MTVLGYAGLGVATAVVGVALWANLPTKLTLPTQRAVVQALAAAPLQTIDQKQTFKAGVLWADSGAVIMAVRRPG